MDTDLPDLVRPLVWTLESEVRYENFVAGSFLGIYPLAMDLAWPGIMAYPVYLQFITPSKTTCLLANMSASTIVPLSDSI